MSSFPPHRRALRLSLAAGAVYDLVLGLVILVAGEKLLAALGSPGVEPRFYLYLGALPLLLLPALYLVAARSAAVDAFRPAVVWARGGGGSILILLTVLLGPPVPGLFMAIGVADLLWLAVHLRLWAASRD